MDIITKQDLAHYLKVSIYGYVSALFKTVAQNKSRA